jgi:hypothetical protein
MKLKYFLLTEGRTQKLSEEDFYQKVKSQCSDILNTYKKGRYYFRGITDFSQKFGLVKPKNFERVSRNTDNYYTLLMDNLPSWKSFPKRSKSIIFTSDKEMGASYGNSYILFPKNGAKIGKAPDQDIWYSFVDLGRKFDKSNFILSDFNDFINNEIKHQNKPKTYDELKLIMQNTEFIYESGKSLWDVFVPLFDPKRNNFSIISPKTPVDSRIVELWTDADCYVMLYWKYEERFNNLYSDNPIIKNQNRPKSILDIKEK